MRGQPSFVAAAVAAIVIGLGVFAWPAAAVPGAGQVQASRRSFDDYVQDLKSTDPNVRSATLRALVASAYPEALVPISTLLTDPVDGIQLEAIDAVLQFYVAELPSGTRRVALIVEKREKTGMAQRVFELGPFVLLPRRTPPEVLTRLASAIRDENPTVRIQSVYALGVVGHGPLEAEVADVLQGGLRDPLPEMRVATARVLGSLRVTGSGDALIAAINDPVPEVRASAMLAVGDLRDARAVQPLTEQFTYYEKGAMAENAFDGLARIAHAASAPLFQSELFNRSAIIRRRAAEGLARIGNPAVAVGVESALADERNAQVQVARAFAMQAAGKNYLDQLVDALRKEATEAQAMGYLVELGSSVSAGLGTYLRDPSPAVRSRVAMVLGLIGGDQAIAALEQARRDSDLETARAVERAIARARMAQS